MTTTVYSARWVLPVTSPPVEHGAVAVSDTLIVGVGARAQLVSKFPDAAVRDFGEAAVLPGLVNCHSHLELTAMRGFLDDVEGDFFAWLKKLTVARLTQMTEDDRRVSATWGAVEAARAGVTCLGDACDGGEASLRALREVGLRGTVFQEVFGPDESFAQEQLDGLREKVSRLRPLETETVRVGVSPHAPYTVSGPLLRLVTEYALAEDLPMMMHAAESEAESRFMLDGAGPFAESLRLRGIEWGAPGVSTVGYLESLGVLRARPLLAHCVRVDAGDIRRLREAGARVAHCPKSNAKFGHGRAPLAAFLEAGVPVGLGSDSVASNNTCDLLEEARFAALSSRAAGETLGGRMLEGGDLLKAATRGGALALGLERRVGALEEGMEADLAVVSLEGAHQLPVYDPAAALVFSSSGRDVLLTVAAGREVFRDGRVLTVDEDDLRRRLRDIARRLSGVEE